MSEVVVVGFDYESLPADVAEMARGAASRIHKLIDTTVDVMLTAGRELAEVKERLPHGQFGSWLEAEFGMSERTAQRYMRVAAWAESKPDTVSHLEPSAVHLLAAPSTPAAVHETVLKKLDEGEIVATEKIRMMVRRVKREEREAREEARLSPDQKRKRKQRDERRRREREKSNVRWEAETAARKEAARRAVVLLRNRLGDTMPEFRRLLHAAGGEFHASLFEEERRDHISAAALTLDPRGTGGREIGSAHASEDDEAEALPATIRRLPS